MSFVPFGLFVSLSVCRCCDGICASTVCRFAAAPFLPNENDRRTKNERFPGAAETVDNSQTVLVGILRRIVHREYSKSLLWYFKLSGNLRM